MRVLVSGNDTGIGKTFVCSFLCSQFANEEDVFYLKPIETGSSSPQDAKHVKQANSNCLTATHFQFSEPLSPGFAARKEGVLISFEEIARKALEDTGNHNISIIEGAGGLATPIDNNGNDWLDFANYLRVDYLILVVEDRLGAINQGRLLSSHLESSSLCTGIWLNETKPQDPTVKKSNLTALSLGPVPVWAVQSHGKKQPDFEEFPWA
jgi:dethiobiotin synthetase